MNLIKYVFPFILIISVAVGCSQESKTEQLDLIGHRGATGLLPENSIPGFKQALEFDVDGIEFDVVISGDNQVVISHEPWFRHDICKAPDGSSITEGEQKEHLLYAMDYEQIKEYDCGSLQRPGYPNQDTLSVSKPLMADALSAVESYRKENDIKPIQYFVEIKSKPAWDNKFQPEPDSVAKLVYEELRNQNLLDRVHILAFDHRVLNTIKKLDSNLKQVYLIPKSKPDMEDNLSHLTHLPDVYAPNYSLVESTLVEGVHAKDMRLIPWTVNQYDDMVRLVNLGVDGIISDYPNYFDKLRNHISNSAN